MNYAFSKHASDRFSERINISLDQFIDYLENRSVLQAIEKDGTKQLVIFLCEQNEFYIVVVSRNTIISIMPAIWRSKSLSHITMDQARTLAGNHSTILNQAPMKKVSKIEFAIYHTSFSKTGSRASAAFKNEDEIDIACIEVNKNFMESFYDLIDDKKIELSSITSVKIRLNGFWTETNKFY